MTTHQQLLYHIVFSTKNNGSSLSFAWQDGFGAFTVSPSKKDAVGNYVRNQLQHHQKLTFEEEYLEFLKKHEVDFDERYVFD
jgi:hypothetical protein